MSIFDRIAAYADDAQEMVETARRRRLDREPFARIHFRGGSIVELEPGSEASRSLGFAARALLERTRDE
ncbi:hypothetical protein HJD18_05270 [Thermoleophilia bacterium SCSIO 60948]|nr:hypothetical protein HJD18_05270 [Thermoleophilia bacterium SCSIO 60948]